MTRAGVPKLAPDAAWLATSERVEGGHRQPIMESDGHLDCPTPLRCESDSVFSAAAFDGA